MLLWIRFAPRLRRAVALATEIAGGRGCDEVAVEHLLLAICGNNESAANFVFEQAGIARSTLLEELDQLAPSGNSQRQRAAKMSSAALHLIDVAGGEADRLKHANIGSELIDTEHIALALTLIQTPIPILTASDFTHDKAEAAVKQWLISGQPQKRTALSVGLLSTLPEPVRKVVRFPSLAWKIFVDKSLGHPRFVSDPYPLYRWLREHQPVRRDPLAPVWVVTRYADVAMLLKDPRFNKDPFAGERLPAMVREQLGITQEQVRTSDVETLSMLFLDPPQHTRVRAVFSRAFTPKMINGLAPRIQQITDKRLEKVMVAGRMDVVSAIAYPLPVVVIAELLGFPPEDYPLYKKWSDDFAAALGFNPSTEQQIAASISRGELQVYFDRLVAELERNPGDNLLSALLAMENEAGALSREEIFINAALLLAAGHETTTNLIANGIWHLLNHPDQLEKLRRNPDLIDGAIEELLRFDSPVQWVSRVAGQALEMGGKQIPAGAILLASLGAANHDADQFAHADQLEIERSDNKHLAFGSGVHFCLGAVLARMEARVAIQTLIMKLPGLRLATRKIKWKKGLIFRAIEKLEVRFDVARGESR